MSPFTGLLLFGTSPCLPRGVPSGIPRKLNVPSIPIYSRQLEPASGCRSICPIRPLNCEMNQGLPLPAGYRIDEVNRSAGPGYQFLSARASGSDDRPCRVRPVSIQPSQRVSRRFQKLSIEQHEEVYFTNRWIVPQLRLTIVSKQTSSIQFFERQSHRLNVTQLCAHYNNERAIYAGRPAGRPVV